MNVVNVVTIYLRSQMAESGPPLGTILGNLGINTVKFCKEFNDFTKDLPSYFLLKVKINILEDKTFTFSVDLPSTGKLISLLKFDRTVDFSGKQVVQSCVYMKDLVQIALLKFPGMELQIVMPIILGSVNSFKDLHIVF